MSRLLSRLGSRPYLKLATGMAVGGGTLLAMSQLKNNTTQNQKPMLPFNAGIQLEASKKGEVEENALHSLWTPPSRDKLIEQLKASVNPDEEYDLLVIGGGATGTGIALDAASRGLKVALVERDDFSSGTSSRSTKLVHGGVRYLEKAFRNLDYEQYKLVVEALHERSVFLKIAPYLSNQLPIMLPVYKWWQVPYYWAGAKFYDLFAGGEGLESSYFMGRSKALENFPMLQKDSLKGAIVYYDGQHNDSRMNVALALTSIAQGATAVNHVEVQDLIKEDTNDLNKIKGAKVKDLITGEEFTIKAKGVINATGPFTDAIRKMDEPTTPTIVAPSAGVHIILPNYYSPAHMGLLDPATSDGRVIFFLPWQGNVIAGTTDTPTNVNPNPMPTEEEIDWILGEIRRYLDPDVQVRRGDVLAAWSGIRPLVRDPAASNTAALVRNHVVHVSQNGLLTIAGGKWTTYRAMAQEAVDEAIKFYGLNPKNECVTERLKLIGSHKYSKTMFIQLIQHFGLETEVAQHLSLNYGDRAWAVAHLCQPTGQRWPLHGTKLTSSYPYLEAEVRHAVRYEYACTATDALARRMRLAFLNAQTTLDVLPRVVDIMAEELGWDSTRKAKEIHDATHYLSSMGLSDWKLLSESSRSRFDPLELGKYRTAFGTVDRENDGHIEGGELLQLVKELNLGVDDRTVAEGAKRAGVNTSGSIEFFEFLEVLGRVKEIKEESNNKSTSSIQQPAKLTTERSGGGV